jgi:hypothetical protein
VRENERKDGYCGGRRKNRIAVEIDENKEGDLLGCEIPRKCHHEIDQAKPAVDAQMMVPSLRLNPSLV